MAMASLDSKYTRMSIADPVWKQADTSEKLQKALLLRI